MNLITLDFGNTRAHAALFRQGKLVHAGVTSDIPGWLTTENLGVGDVSGILSQVKAHENELQDLLQRGLLIERIKDYWRGERFTGMPVDYAQTLGEDRLVQAWHAFKRFPTPTLIIGAGSFFTIDVVTPRGFTGGFILPGLGKLSDDLGEGAQLASANFQSITKDLVTGARLPSTTAEALQGAAAAYIALLQKQLLRWDIGQVLVTGGDAGSVMGWLTSLNAGVTLHHEPHLMHASLHEWYNRNLIS
jgi:pantothenate kinase type III